MTGIGNGEASPVRFLFLFPQPFSVAKEVYAKDSAYSHE